jgi:hypothetical protein
MLGAPPLHLERRSRRDSSHTLQWSGEVDLDPEVLDGGSEAALGHQITRGRALRLLDQSPRLCDGVTPHATPLELLGPRAVASISRELESAGIAVESATRIDVEGGHAQTVLLQPSGRRIEVERMLALPALRGRPIAGIPTDADGFIEVDEHCRVRGCKACGRPETARPSL